MNVVKRFMYVQALAGPIRDCPDHTAIRDGPGVKAVWVEPVSAELVAGSIATWASVARVQPCRLPGYWIDKAGTDIPINQRPVRGEKVVYCLHGGSYTSLSAHPSDLPAAVARGILQHCEPVLRAFSLEYRLSSTAPYPEAHPFPTAIIDALSGYTYLVNAVGFAPEDIVVEGDSAGGNLALALVRYLVEHAGHPGLPRPPGALVLLSPWTDIGTSHEGPGTSMAQLTMDYLGDMSAAASRGLWSRRAYLGPHGLGVAEHNAYVSPASLAPGVASSARFTGFPKTFIAVGGSERFYDQILELRERMARDMGEEGQVTLFEAPDAVHDYICLEWHEPERTSTLQAIAEVLVFLEQLNKKSVLDKHFPGDSRVLRLDKFYDRQTRCTCGWVTFANCQKGFLIRLVSAIAPCYSLLTSATTVRITFLGAMSDKPEFPALVYKIVDAEPPTPIPSELPLSALDAHDGFIHLSDAHQVPITADLFFASHERLWVLKISSSAAQGGSGRLVRPGGLPGCAHLHQGKLGAGTVVGIKEYGRVKGKRWADVMAPSGTQREWLVDEDQ
ncbi:hypothetical protein HWV62_29579 [Athelia sp. TMB]|nr:hypothetical protein HWV62_29579 [Athelia sp. TMB]